MQRFDNTAFKSINEGSVYQLFVAAQLDYFIAELFQYLLRPVQQLPV